MPGQRPFTLPPRTYNILVVDDEPVVLDVMRGALDRPDYQVADVQDVNQVMTRAAVEVFDLLIIDKNLPGVTGLELVSEVQAINPSIATMVMTAYPTRESVEEAMTIGVDDYITKPFTVTDLQERVEACLWVRTERVRIVPGRTRKPGPVRVVVCAPQAHMRQTLVAGLKSLGHWVSEVDGIGEILANLERGALDSLVCDLDVLDRDVPAALQLRTALLRTPEIGFVALAGRMEMGEAIRAVRRGAHKVLYRQVESEESVAESLRAFYGL